MAELITLARPYAKAIFQVALAEDSLASWSEMLDILSGVTCDKKVATALSSPSLTGEQQAKIVTDLCGEEINGQIQNFVSVLAENSRLELLPEIVSLYESLRANQERTVDVDVVSAFLLGNETQEKIANALTQRLQRKVNIRTEVDKSLIGGIVVRAGDLVIDGSVRGKLEKLAEAMNS